MNEVTKIAAKINVPIIQILVLHAMIHSTHDSEVFQLRFGYSFGTLVQKKVSIKNALSRKVLQQTGTSRQQRIQ